MKVKGSCCGSQNGSCGSQNGSRVEASALIGLKKKHSKPSTLMTSKTPIFDFHAYGSQQLPYIRKSITSIWKSKWRFWKLNREWKSRGRLIPHFQNFHFGCQDFHFHFQKEVSGLQMEGSGFQMEVLDFYFQMGFSDFQKDVLDFQQEFSDLQMEFSDFRMEVSDFQLEVSESDLQRSFCLPNGSFRL